MVYTPAFGGSVPIKIDGTAATVAGGVITDVRAVAAGETVAIPANGYVMVFGNDFTSTSWYREPAVGTSVTLTPGLTDSDTSGFPMEEITAMVSGGPRLVENGAICTTLEPGFQEARFTSAVTSRTALGKLGHRLHRLRFHSAASGADAPAGLRGGGQSGWRRLHRAGLSGEADPLPGTGTDDDPANFYPLIC